MNFLLLYSCILLFGPLAPLVDRLLFKFLIVREVFLDLEKSFAKPVQ